MDTKLFVSLYALLNIYLYAIAWLYAPNDNVHSKLSNLSEVEKERQKIMNEFYQNEGLGDDDDTNETFEIE